MDHAESIIETYISLIPSLFKKKKFHMRLLYYKHNEEENAVEAIFFSFGPASNVPKLTHYGVV